MENNHYPGGDMDTGSVSEYETSTGVTSYSDVVPMQADSLEANGVIVGFMIAFLFVMIPMYIYYAMSFQRMAQKINIPDDWYAWVPVLNLVLLFRIANRPLWWIALLIVPGVNIIISIVVWMDVAKAMGKPEWWGILTVIPVVNLIVPGYLAFSNGVVPVYDAEITPVLGNDDAFAYSTTVVKDPKENLQKKTQGGEGSENQLEQDLKKMQKEELEKKDNADLQG